MDSYITSEIVATNLNETVDYDVFEQFHKMGEALLQDNEDQANEPTLHEIVATNLNETVDYDVFEQFHKMGEALLQDNEDQANEPTLHEMQVMQTRPNSDNVSTYYEAENRHNPCHNPAYLTPTNVAESVAASSNHNNSVNEFLQVNNSRYNGNFEPAAKIPRCSPVATPPVSSLEANAMESPVNSIPPSPANFTNLTNTSVQPFSYPSSQNGYYESPSPANSDMQNSYMSGYCSSNNGYPTTPKAPNDAMVTNEPLQFKSNPIHDSQQMQELVLNPPPLMQTKNIKMESFTDSTFINTLVDPQYRSTRQIRNECDHFIKKVTTNTGKKLFQCTQCPSHEPFSQKCRARTHVTGEHMGISYKCPECIYTSKRADNISVHTASIHGFRLVKAKEDIQGRFKKAPVLEKSLKRKAV